MKFSSLLAAILVTAGPVLALGKGVSVSDLPHGELAESFLESMGRNPKAPRQLNTPESILADQFLVTSIGLFEVSIPVAALKRRSTSKDYRDICLALSEAQNEWVNWLGDGAKDGKTLSKSLSTLSTWIGDWDEEDLMDAGEGDFRDSLDLHHANEETRELSTELSQTFREASVVGEARKDLQPVKLVLMPDRKQFVEFVAYAGWYLPGARNSFWMPGCETWSFFHLNDFQVIALEYASPTAHSGDYTQSYSMKSKSPTGMEEQVVQIGLNKFLAYEHGEALPPSLVSSLALNLVTRLYGACHTRIDGDTRGKVTQKREVFVRGGRPEGGILPPNTAESRWRQNYGKDHYTPILKQAQKAGASAQKKRSKRYNAFQLEDEYGSNRYVTHAPLLGPSAGVEEVVPDAVYGDYLEFNRAYRSAFLYWLQHHGAKSKKKSAKAFGEFICQVSGSADVSISEIAESVYGKPLSNQDADKKSLEGSFLRWLSKQ